MEKQNRKISANHVLIFKQRHGYHSLCLNLIEFNKRFEEGYVNIYSICGNMWGRLWGNWRMKTVGETLGVPVAENCGEKLWGKLRGETAGGNCGGIVGKLRGELRGKLWENCWGGGEIVNYRMVLKKETRLRGYSTMAGGKC